MTITTTPAYCMLTTAVCSASHCAGSLQWLHACVMTQTSFCAASLEHAVTAAPQQAAHGSWLTQHTHAQHISCTAANARQHSCHTHTTPACSQLTSGYRHQCISDATLLLLCHAHCTRLQGHTSPAAHTMRCHLQQQPRCCSPTTSPALPPAV